MIRLKEFLTKKVKKAEKLNEMFIDIINYLISINGDVILPFEHIFDKNIYVIKKPTSIKLSPVAKEFIPKNNPAL